MAVRATQCRARTLAAAIGAVAAPALLVLAVPLAAGSNPPSLAKSAPPAADDGDKPATDEAAPYVPGQIIVTYRDGVTAAQRDAMLSRKRARGHDTISRRGGRHALTEVVRLPAGVSVEQAVAQYEADPTVAHAEPDYLLTAQVEADDTYAASGDLWGMGGDAMPLGTSYGSGANEAWAMGHVGSASVYVGIVDEGVQFDHPDIAANVWTNPWDPVDGIDNDGNGYIDDVHGWDFVNDDNDVFDGDSNPDIDSHGTHVAGTIGGVGGNGQGVAGVNWDVTMIPAKFLGPSSGSTSDAIAALNYLTELKVLHGINLVATNNSWSGGNFSVDLLNAINDGGDEDILFVTVAGNGGTNNDSTPSYPGNYQCTNGGTRGWDCVVSVAAIDAVGALPVFSQYGATTVDLAAPGDAIISTVPDDTYAAYSGTSMAAPHVAGAVALCASINPALTAAQLRAAVVDTALPTASLSGKTVTGGRLDVGTMVQDCVVPTSGVSGSVDALATATVARTSVALVWDDQATGETRFEVQRAPFSGTCGTYAAIGAAPAGGEVFTAADLTPATTYCFRVRAASDYGGGSSTGWAVVSNVTTPEPPSPYNCAATSYRWLTPSAVSTADFGDDSTVGITVPFTPWLYDVAFPNTFALAEVQASSNGYLHFGWGSAGFFANSNMPNSAHPNGIVAAWWDDLDPYTGGSISWGTLGSAPTRRFVVTWSNVPHLYLSYTTVTFQIVIEETTNAFVFNYLDTETGSAGSNRGAGATVGIESADGHEASVISHNAGNINNSSAYRCTPYVEPFTEPINDPADVFAPAVRLDV
jgi:subtilisin family serine protease